MKKLFESEGGPGLYRRNLIRLIKANNIRRFAEIGVAYGNTARAILQACEGQIQEYYAIDPWKPYRSAGMMSELKKMNKENWDKMFEKVCHKLGKFEVVKVLRLTSEQASPLFKPQSLDMVFIDGSHSFEAVTMDIELWSPKIRKGGLLTGHDYNSQPPHSPCPEVYEAVQAAFPLGVKEIPRQIWVVEIK